MFARIGPKAIAGVSAKRTARMERKLEKLNRDYRAQEATFADDVLQVILASKFFDRLIVHQNVA